MKKRIVLIFSLLLLFTLSANAQFDWTKHVDTKRYALATQTDRFVFFFDTKTLKFARDEFGKPVEQFVIVQQIQYFSEKYKDKVTQDLKKSGRTLPADDRVAYYLSHIFYDLHYDRYSVAQVTLYTEKGRIISDDIYPQEFRHLASDSAGAVCLAKIKRYVQDNYSIVVKR